VLVASWRDADRVRRIGRPIILMEHGVGQHFAGLDHASYSGATEHRVLAMRLVPNDYSAQRHIAAHPRVPVAVIGCPKLDGLVDLPSPVNGPVALANHWGDKTQIPEMGGAWFQWHEHYAAVPVAFPGALGHNHPKLWTNTSAVLARLGFEPVRWFSEVARRASVYVSDGVSTLYEFAALDRPVVVLNPPSFRRDVNHGGRVWDWADVGVQVDDPGDIVDAIREAKRDLPTQAQRRRDVVEEVYPFLGHSGLEGARVLQEHFA
jgi:hypothetical protein